MTVFVPTLDERELAELRADVRQLVSPWQGQVWRSWHTWTRSRNKRVHRERMTLTYPPLLDQMRAAVHPGGAGQRGPERRGQPGSRPPLALDPADQLGRLCRELAEWQRRIGRQDAPPGCTVVDTQKWALVQFASRARDLHQPVGEELAADVRKWWTWAARQSGWNPEALLAARHAG